VLLGNNTSNWLKAERLGNHTFENLACLLRSGNFKCFQRI